MNYVRIILLLLPVCLGQSSRAVDFSSKGPLTTEILQFQDLADSARSGRKVPIKIHIPKEGGPFPLIIASHGAGGNVDAHYAHAQHLASHGYAVICVEHKGSNTRQLTKGLRVMKNLSGMLRDSDEVMNRPKDVSFAINKAEEWNTSHEKLRGRINIKKIGVMGHSYGAFTTMLICGMRPALDELTPPVPPGEGPGPDLSDKRVACGLALSPQSANLPFFTPECFLPLSIPLMGISGTKDKQQNALPPIRRYEDFALWPKSNGQNKFLWLETANHLDFSDNGGTRMTRVPSKTRPDVQRIVRAAMLLFFEAHLKSDSSAEKLLTTEGLSPYCHGQINKLELRSK
ncbi:MAG: hypothetical protein A2020_15940 [Lentisphaerae bacterium GWF2_45_14]|nr:MAG: hypothetical protein A2020_15940 [Lentisphaerae bacterium GWF2_45_14]